jgi:phosphatidyl-myo-inositol dimannoside synthase
MSGQLLLAYDFPPMGGGISRWMGELAKRFPPGSLIVSTGQAEKDRDADLKLPNRVDRLPIPSRRLRTVQGTVLWSRRVAAIARSVRPEFIWCGNLKPAGYPAHWTRRQVGTPYGVLLHGGDLLILRHQIKRSLKRRTARLLLTSASVLVANSRWTAELCRTLLEEMGIRFDQERVRVVPLGTDPAFFHPGAASDLLLNRYGLDQRRWLLTVARLTHHKGIDIGIHLLARLRARYADLGYIVVGRGEELEQLKQLANRLGVADRVRFLTEVPDQDLPTIYSSGVAYLGLSRLMEQRAEGFGIALLEAAACGLPVIAARTGGIPDAVRDGETGVLVDPGDVGQVEAAVSRVLDDPALASRLGQAGRRAVETFYNWNRVAADLEQIGREAGKRKLLTGG